MHGRRKNYRAWDAQQCSQEPVAPRDALPEDDLVFFLLDLVPQIDLSPFHQYYAQELRGQRPFEPLSVTIRLTSAQSAISARSTWRRFGPCSSRCCAWLARWVWSSLETCPPTGRRWERTPRGTRR